MSDGLAPMRLGGPRAAVSPCSAADTLLDWTCRQWCKDNTASCWQTPITSCPQEPGRARLYPKIGDGLPEAADLGGCPGCMWLHSLTGQLGAALSCIIVVSVRLNAWEERLSCRCIPRPGSWELEDFRVWALFSRRVRREEATNAREAAGGPR